MLDSTKEPSFTNIEQHHSYVKKKYHLCTLVEEKGRDGVKRGDGVIGIKGKQ